MTIAVGSRTPSPPKEIVGLVADAVYRALREPVPATMYIPVTQFDDSRGPAPASVAVSVRSPGGSPALLARSVGAAISAENRDLALTFRRLSDQVNASLTQERVVAMLSGFFGGLALLPRDPATIVGASVVLAAVGALAGWLPAHRASRIDPAEVLRDSYNSLVFVVVNV